MKNNKGITMVTLVIIIVVLLILSGVSIGIGSISVTSYKDSVLNSEAKRGTNGRNFTISEIFSS